MKSEAKIGDAATVRECQDYHHHWKLEETRKDASLEPAKGAQPTDTWLPEPGKNPFLLFGVA